MRILVGLGALATCLVAAIVATANPAGGRSLSVVGEWPGWTGKVSCGTPFDPLVAFARPADAERGSRPSEVALRRHLAKTRHYATHSPPHRWRLLVETKRHAEFSRGDLANGGIEVNRFERGPEGWEWAGFSGSCQPTRVRHRQSAITWTLARGQQLTASTRVVKVDLGPGKCDSGGGPDGRLEPARFREESGALLMTLWLRPPPPPVPGAAYICPAVIEPPVTIPLPEPLGERELLDGGVFPPLSSAAQLRRDEGV
jgi:hypothetical protein